MWPEIKRKFFHLSALVYVVGLIYIPRTTYLIVLGIALALNICMEMARIKSEKARMWFVKYFGGLLRKDELTKFSGVFWMLLGVLITVAMARPIPIAAAAFLYLILGDGVASLAGMRLRGPHWPGSKKRISGSAACFAACLFVGLVILKAGYGWKPVVAGAVVATAIEGMGIPINDNFTIPVLSAIALLLSS